MTTALLTFYSSDWLPIADLTRANKGAYCARHGYTHVETVGPYHDAKLYYAIDRLYCVKDLLFVTDYDTVFVLNAPSLITNLTVPLESRLDADHDFFIGLERDHLNAGAFVIRRSDWSRQWLDLLIKDAPGSGVWFENAAMIHHHGQSPWCERIKVCEPGVIQSYHYPSYPIDYALGNWKPGDFVLGMPGLNREQRTGLINVTLPQVVS